MNFIVDKERALKKWNPILESLKISDPDKKEWMSEYAEMHQMNENVAYTTLGSLNGMGAVYSPQPSAVPGSVWSADAAKGSGDVGQNLLPVSMKIAAQTIGLDLVAVKPVASPKVDLLFVDFKYDNNLDEDEDRPLVFKIASVNASIIEAALYLQMANLNIKEKVGGLTGQMFVGLASLIQAGVVLTNITKATDKRGVLEFLGFSKVDGKPMFRSFRQVQAPVNNGTPSFDVAKNTFGTTGSIESILSATNLITVSGVTTGATVLSATTVELVSLMEDHIPGFSAGWMNYQTGGMDRATDEKTYPGIIGPSIFNKTIQVGTVEISSALKRTQIEDIKAATGIDIVQKLESVLINELSQTISKEIVQKISELGELNRVSHTTPKVAGVSKFDLNVDTYLTTVGAQAGMAETTHSIQRKLIAKINNASNFIANDGRVGPAQYIVTNGNIASVIQDIAGYTINPVNAGKMNTNGQLYPVGKLGNMDIYVDPYMMWDDNRIFIGRKNTADQPGLLFLPYLMAQSISLISEATFAPRMLIRSRYAIADVGFFPEKQFMSIKVTDTNGVLI
jgi:hypothetical protein